MVRLQPGAKWHEGEHEPLGRSGEPCFWSYKGSEASFRILGPALPRACGLAFGLTFAHFGPQCSHLLKGLGHVVE